MTIEERIITLQRSIRLAVVGKDNPCRVPSGPKGGEYCSTGGGISGGGAHAPGSYGFYKDRYPVLDNKFSTATSTLEVGRIRREANKAYVDDVPGAAPAGAIKILGDYHNERVTVQGGGSGRVRTPEEARADQILRTRDSSGRASGRK